MSDFLDRLIANEHGTEPAFMPRVQARFEADRSQAEPLESFAEALATNRPAPPSTPANPNSIATAHGRESTMERTETTRSHEQRMERIVEIARESERHVVDTQPTTLTPRQISHTDDSMSSRTRTADSPERPAIQPERIVISRAPDREDATRPTAELWRDDANTTVAKSPTAPERLLTAPHATRSEHSQATAQETPAEPVVHVSIGRLEVRATAPNEPARRRATPPPAGRLERYLEERNRGRAK